MKQWLTEPFWKTISLLLISFSLCCTQDPYYIAPTPNTLCPGEPCHTLSQYGEQYFQNFNSNTTLVFLPGDHLLNYTISIGTASDFPRATHTYQQDNPYPSLSLLGSPYQAYSSSLQEIRSRIVCTWPAGFVFSGIVELHINALAFISCGHNDSAALNIQSVWNARISNCAFQYNTNGLSGSRNNGYGGAIHVHNSTLSLSRNTFHENFAHQGAVLYAHSNNTLTLSENTFQSNSADLAGGALFVNTSNTLTLSGNTFQNNTASELSGGALYAQHHNTLIVIESKFQKNSADYGGALYAYSNNTLTISENTFQSNSADASGGALYVGANNTLTLSENTYQNNSGIYGGVLYANSNNTLTLSENTFQNNSGIYGVGIYANSNNTLTLSENTFQSNSADLAGGALFVNTSNTLTLSGNTFQNNTASELGGALYAQHHNTLIIIESKFQNNSASELSGGALYAQHHNTLIIIESKFQKNLADYGGALYAYSNNTLTISENTFQNNPADTSGGALHVGTNNTLTLSENTYQNNSGIYGGALYAHSNNTLTLTENTFQNNSVGTSGGALYVGTNNTLTLSKNTYQNNSGIYGGVLYAHSNNTFTLSENTFQNNSADTSGGALYVDTNNTLTIKESTFQNNSAEYGGGLYANSNNTLTISENTFQNNSADTSGGALHARQLNTLTIKESTFQNNSAPYGGALFVGANNTITLSMNTYQNNSGLTGGVFYAYENNTLTISGNTFQCNSVYYYGGVICAFTYNTLTLTGNTFENNSADKDGGALFVRQSTTNLTNNNLTGNLAHSIGGAVFSSNSNLSMHERHSLQNNQAQYGGGIAALQCQIILSGDFRLESNKASLGGGLYLEMSNTSGYGYFSENSASEFGGGIFASGSELYFKEHIIFDRNSAQNGGGLLLTEDSRLFLQPNTTVKFTNNCAKKRGGAINVEDNDPLTGCAGVPCQFSIQPDCFFQIQTQGVYDSKTNLSEITELHDVRIYFRNNKAHQAGGTLYGGSVDNCSLRLLQQRIQNQYQFQLFNCPRSGEVFNYITSSNEEHPDISSNPLYICACENSDSYCNVPFITRSVYPGGKLVIPVTAYGQRNGTTPAVIQNQTPPGGLITIDNLETTQNVTNSCTVLSYTVQTRAVGTTQEMTLIVKGPCPPTGRTISSKPTNLITIRVSILPCPPGFQLLTEHCGCAKRLQSFMTTCYIESQEIELTGGEFWVGYDNTSDGLILYPRCPFDYCTSQTLNITVNNSDEQCSSNRTGLLCGKCGETFSLVLGTNRCLQCSNNNLWLIVVFGFAGIVLVLVLYVLRLTVAVGTINGLLFYVNVFAINSAVFLQPQTTNPLTVFISWLNLDLGIETCFYNGMDMYAKAWLQFVYPFYLWVLLIAIIITSHYSIRISTILGNSTIEVLATLILLSYAKLLRAIIAALYYAQLDYPNNMKKSVWLSDANVMYLSNKHIPLFTVAVFCLIFLFLPYTMLLIFGQWLRAKSEWKIFSWINHHRVLPFLEAYHAPYTEKHRYWTGLMLLVRTILILIFAFNIFGDPKINMLCMACSTILLNIFHAIFGSKIYKTWPLTILELSFNTNLCILTIATLYTNTSRAGSNQNAVTFTSISIAFATFVGIVIYHIARQIKEVPHWWKRVFPSQRQEYETIPPRNSTICEHSLPNHSRAPTVTYLDIHNLSS